MQSRIFITSILVVSLMAQAGGTPRLFADDPPAPSGLVELRSGADSAEAALDAMVAASNTGDDQAAMLMIDPAIRPLLRPNIAIERFAIDSYLFEIGMFGEPDGNVGGILFWFTLRDLVRIRSVKLLETRVVDDKRVVFTVLTTEKSYHGEEHIHKVCQFLAIQRSDRWYLFRPFGMLSHLLQGRSPMSSSDEQLSLLLVHRPCDERTNREDADYELEYLLPIELIHEHLVAAAKDPKIKEYNEIAENVQRSYNNIVNRAKRGDYESRSQLKSAMEPLEEWVDTLSEVTFSLEPGLREFGAKNLPVKDSVRQ
ncbi:hypothetical protein [Allorhodopirellula solitaria]|uniref:Uncharacterized protein n=1 Tax=Allorhodopirellula solitaria TaxID=2527987 RepID=A0A5C5YG74_9BACT|nr:hypothetical protein [Allorhodopirellula solitaria]TWT74118.1 hypothetical protein CA85_10040 [Allorhodopirellula solitaria]